MTIQNKERKCQNSKRISDKVIIKEIQALYKELGYPPHAGQYSRYATAINHFKTTWPEILKMAGINATFCSDKGNVSKEKFAFKVLNLVRSKNLSYLPADKTLRENGIGPTYIYKYWVIHKISVMTSACSLSENGTTIFEAPLSKKQLLIFQVRI